MADSDAHKTMGTKSTEKLVHFRCRSCAKWWTIADAPARDEWHCPWCGNKQSFVDKTPKNLGN